MLGRLLLFDALEMRFRELRLRKDPECPVCGREPSIRELRDSEASCALPEPTAPVAADGAIDVGELQARIVAGERPFILDVRTRQEWAIGHIAGATLVPLQELAQRFDELDPQQETVVYCHVGGRSATAVRFLHERGFSRVRNLLGGIDAWSREVDSSIPRY